MILAHTTLWYRFDYPGHNSQVTVKLPNGAAKLLQFSIVSPEQAIAWWNAPGIGAGATKGSNLIWSRRSPQAGTYYVKVTNNNPYAVIFDLLIE